MSPDSEQRPGQGASSSVPDRGVGDQQPAHYKGADHSEQGGTPSDLERIARILIERCGVVELRALDAPYSKVVSGYFNNAADLVRAARSIDGKCSGVYVTINEFNPALLARAHNRAVPKPKATTSDADVQRRRFFYIDSDPRRPSGISATDAERALAVDTSEQVLTFLTRLGFPEPMRLDSGNGSHLLFAIDLPANDGGLIERALRALAFRFDSESVLIDCSVHNPARITKLYGTLACKGDNVPDRPHRRSRIISCPETLEVVPLELLEKLAAMCPPTAGTRPDGASTGARVLDVEAFIARHSLSVSKSGAWKDAHRWILETCPFNGAHADRSAYIIQFSNGALAFGCHHNGCRGKGWKDLRELLDPARRDERSRATASETPSSPRPKLRSLPDYEPFPLHLLPFPLNEFVAEGARALGCDPSFLALPLLAVIASAIGNSRRIELKRTWSEPAVIWTVIVGESGTMKSPALDLSLKSLRRRQNARVREFEREMEEFQTAVQQHKVKRRQWAKKGEGEQPAPPKRPTAKRLYCVETTIEALLSLLSENPRGVLLARDEASGWLRSFNAYRKGQGGDVATWLEMHRANPITVDRKTPIPTIINIPHAAVSLTGGIQPEIMRDALQREHFVDGLAARLLVAMPPRVPKQWSEAELSQQLENEMEVLLNRLLMLGMVGNTDCTEPKLVPLSQTGRDAWIAFYNEHAQQQAEMVGDLAAAWSKLEGYAARFALIIHLVRWAADDPTLVTIDQIDDESIRRGVGLTRWFGREADRVYSVLGESEDDTERRQLLDWIRKKGGTVTLRDLERGPRKYRGQPDAARAALDELAQLRLGTWIWLPSGPKGGAPAHAFRLAEPEPGDTTPREDPAAGVVDPSPASPHSSCADTGRDVPTEMDGSEPRQDRSSTHADCADVPASAAQASRSRPTAEDVSPSPLSPQFLNCEPATTSRASESDGSSAQPGGSVDASRERTPEGHVRSNAIDDFEVCAPSSEVGPRRGDGDTTGDQPLATNPLSPTTPQTNGVQNSGVHRGGVHEREASGDTGDGDITRTHEAGRNVSSPDDGLAAPDPAQTRLLAGDVPIHDLVVAAFGGTDESGSRPWSPCRGCGSTRRWRRRGSASAKCPTCHAPTCRVAEVEWLEVRPADGGAS